ncbi:hypothetical protein [Deinococcus planocerae]|uniref:hypothetical protein n=1 Tax=Deinococcus planocerae TaxID=1737569 RepID=UPI000C7EA146|nr:hypothetical protein [Deinococcus planocerae]
MKKLLGAATVAFTLTACGGSGVEEVFPLTVVGVNVPATVSSTEALRVDVRAYNLSTCEGFDHRLSMVSRTAQALTLRAESVGRRSNRPCPPVVEEGTLSYTDPGTPARVGPFEVIVNGKSWGEVGVQ